MKVGTLLHKGESYAESYAGKTGKMPIKVFLGPFGILYNKLLSTVNSRKLRPPRNLGHSKYFAKYYWEIWTTVDLLLVAISKYG